MLEKDTLGTLRQSASPSAQRQGAIINDFRLFNCQIGIPLHQQLVHYSLSFLPSYSHLTMALQGGSYCIQTWEEL